MVVINLSVVRLLFGCDYLILIREHTLVYDIEHKISLLFNKNPSTFINLGIKFKCVLLESEQIVL